MLRVLLLGGGFSDSGLGAEGEGGLIRAGRSTGRHDAFGIVLLLLGIVTGSIPRFKRGCLSEVA